MSFLKKVLIASLAAGASAWAIQATPFLLNSTQPDGSVVQIRKVGNEHVNYTVTADDSVLVVRDTEGFWNYADENGKKTGMRVHAKSKRKKKELDFLKKRDSRHILKSFYEKRVKMFKERREKDASMQPQMLQASGPQLANDFGGWGGYGWGETVTNTGWPTRPVATSVKKEGEVRGLVLLVQFSDVKFSRDNPKDEYEDYLNKIGYSEYSMSGSVRDYFISNSFGKYRPTFDVVGPITLSKTRDSYGAQVNPNNMAAGAVNAISEAMDELVAQNMDFSPYDSDGDKVVDFVYMIFAGVGAADTDVETAIWPHSYNVRKRLTSGYYMNRYACSAEIDGQAYMFSRRTTTLNGIGTFCHEFSHVLGLQDHYDVNANTTKGTTRYTPGKWDLMDAGSYNCPSNRYYTTSCSPANMSAFERFSLGWLEPRRLEVSDTTFVLNSVSDNDGLVLTSENDNEYYFVEFRLQEGFDVALPNKGMLIWHVNYDKTAWYYNEVNTKDPMRVDLIEADGKADAYTISADAFPTNRVKNYNGFVTWAGDSLGLEVYDIAIDNRTVKFKTRGSRVSPDAGKSSSSVAALSSSAITSSASVSSSETAPQSSAARSSTSEAMSHANESSTSVVLSSSSVQALSSNSVVASSSSTGNESLVSNNSSSSKTEPVAFNRVLAASAVRFITNKGLLMVNADIEGHKTIRLFDANGTLLLTKSFDGKFCEVQISPLRGKTFVVATLESNGRLIKSAKVRTN